MDSIVNQAFNYKNNHPTCRYIITSNFHKLRLYIDHSDAFEEFDLFEMGYERFELFYYLLNKESIFANTPLKLKEDSKLKEQDISNELYKKYAGLRTRLFENIIKNNTKIDKLTLLNKTQKLLDRMVFIFFAEDRGILPTNTIATIIEHYKNDIEDRELYHFYKIYFKAINEGNPKINISEYNGGLFAEDEILDSLKIDDEVLEACPLALSAYDFNTDIDVNILGHIFENSLSDIEELKANIENQEFDKTKTKRKKDGVFYTPEYITKYIVDNTLGKLCHEKKKELELDNIDINIPKTKALNKTEKKILTSLETYREYLLNLKILDPACGSGAFLNQALNFLLSEHEFIDEGIKTLMGGNVLGLYDVKKGILENNLYGVDINSEAVEIAKLSLWLRTVEHGRKLNILSGKIKVGNSLIDDKSVADDAFVWEEEFKEVFEQGGFDVVIGNPPYVRQEIIKAISPYLEKNYISYSGKADLFVYFYEKGIKLLKENGYLSLISSGKFFEADYGKALIKFLIKNVEIQEIINFGDLEVFEGISAYPLIFTGCKKIQIKEAYNFNYIYIPKLNFKVLQDVLTTIPFNCISFQDFVKNNYKFYNQKIAKLIYKLKENSFRLDDIGLNPLVGIKTGFNDAFVVQKNSLLNTYPYIFGKDIKKYSLLENDIEIIFPYIQKNSQYILDDFNNFNETIQEYLITNKEKLSKRAIIKDGIKKGTKIWYEYQQINRSLNFKDEYIIYPNVSLGNNFTLSSEKVIDMTSFIIPSNDKVLLAILNSKIVEFLMSIWAISRRGGYLEYKTQYIQEIPLKFFNSVDKVLVEKLVNDILKLNKNFQNKKNKFLKRLQSNFDIEKPSKKLEAFYELDFKTFLKELKKKKVTLTLKEQDEWEEYFESYQKELLEIKAEIDKTDKEIDEMVYKLYGLSEEEVAVVEGIK
jgi:type I restriction-modification system DNA methylase subunit